ncbi:MAG: signal peptidase II [Candidatus Nanoarchaeia archaeon]|nr:signal peptidase II [Candidatus Nanoarchaeia archaeon]
MKKSNNHFLFFISAIAIVALDQALKFIVRRNMDAGQSVPLLKNFFHITYIRNFGAGFGIFQGKTTLFIWFAVIMIGLILFYYDRIIEKKPLQIASALILGGTVSNLMDRIFFGFVVDYFDFRFFPVFNIGDSCITIGALILIIYLIKQEK